jgi:hypothetical protein
MSQMLRVIAVLVVVVVAEGAPATEDPKKDSEKKGTVRGQGRRRGKGSALRPALARRSAEGRRRPGQGDGQEDQRGATEGTRPIGMDLRGTAAS